VNRGQCLKLTVLIVYYHLFLIMENMYLKILYIQQCRLLLDYALK